jgi:hypothetical protein
MQPILRDLLVPSLSVPVLAAGGRVEAWSSQPGCRIATRYRAEF